MALVQNPIIGKASGSVGNITFAGWKGKNVMKTKAQNSYSTPTQEQLNNNEKFATLVAFYRTISGLVTSGFKALAVGQSEYNGFIAENPYSTSVIGTSGNYKVATNLIKISKGPELQSVLGIVQVLANGANGLNIEWNPSGNYNPDWPMVVAAFDRTSGAFIKSTTGLISDQNLVITSDGIGTNIASVDVYAFYCNLSTGKACDSVKGT